MARPIKQGLDYFPLDVDLDDKANLIEAKYGIVGFGIFVKLLQKIYKNGYYLEWDEEKSLLFKKAINVDINTINDVINDCFRWQLLCKRLFDTYKILTSTGIQKRYVEATKRRKSVELTKEYLLIDVIPMYGEGVIVTITSINADNNSQNDDSGTQSKVKKSKVVYMQKFFDKIFEIYPEEKCRSKTKCKESIRNWINGTKSYQKKKMPKLNTHQIYYAIADYLDTYESDHENKKDEQPFQFAKNLETLLGADLLDYVATSKNVYESSMEKILGANWQEYDFEYVE